MKFLNSRKRIKSVNVEGDFSDEVLKDAIHTEKSHSTFKIILASVFIVIGMVVTCLQITDTGEMAFEYAGLKFMYSYKFIGPLIILFGFVLALFSSPNIKLKK